MGIPVSRSVSGRNHEADIVEREIRDREDPSTSESVAPFFIPVFPTGSLRSRAQVYRAFVPRHCQRGVPLDCGRAIFESGTPSCETLKCNVHFVMCVWLSDSLLSAVVDTDSGLVLGAIHPVWFERLGWLQPCASFFSVSRRLLNVCGLAQRENTSNAPSSLFRLN